MGKVDESERRGQNASAGACHQHDEAPHKGLRGHAGTPACSAHLVEVHPAVQQLKPLKSRLNLLLPDCHICPFTPPLRRQTGGSCWVSSTAKSTALRAEMACQPEHGCVLRWLCLDLRVSRQQDNPAAQANCKLSRKLHTSRSLPVVGLGRPWNESTRCTSRCAPYAVKMALAKMEAPPRHTPHSAAGWRASMLGGASKGRECCQVGLPPCAAVPPVAPSYKKGAHASQPGKFAPTKEPGTPRASTSSSRVRRLFMRSCPIMLSP